MKRFKWDEKIYLTKLPEGTSAVIDRIVGNHHFKSRAVGRGITPGTELLMVQNFGLGPLIVYLRDTEIALSRTEAEKIFVMPYMPL